MKKIVVSIAAMVMILGITANARAASFADYVISYTIGSPNDAPFATNASIPQGVTGSPDWNISLPLSSPPSPSDPYYQSYVNLGVSGKMVLKMDSWIEDGPGNDLIVNEIGSMENIYAYVSNDLQTWIDLGLGSYSNGPVSYSTAWLYDFSGVVNGPVKYVKLVDDGDNPGGHGADIDALQGLYATPVPEPATMLLLGSGLAGLAGLRRKLKAKTS